MKTTGLLLAAVFACASWSVARAAFSFNELQGTVVPAQQPHGATASDSPSVAAVEDYGLQVVNASDTEARWSGHLRSADDEPDSDVNVNGDDKDRAMALEEGGPQVLDAGGLPIYH